MTGVVIFGGERLGIVVSQGSWRVCVHRTNCGHYRGATHRNRPVSPGMALVLCRSCQPSEEEVAGFLPTVGLYAYAHGVGATRAVAPHELGAGDRP